MPKSVAITYGVCRNELIFHDIPTSDVTFMHDSGKVGKISVLGGSLILVRMLMSLHGSYLVITSGILDAQMMGLSKLYFPPRLITRMTKIVKVPV
jgi:hypothetical protein